MIVAAANYVTDFEGGFLVVAMINALIWAAVKSNRRNQEKLGRAELQLHDVLKLASTGGTQPSAEKETKGSDAVEEAYPWRGLLVQGRITTATVRRAGAMYVDWIELGANRTNVSRLVDGCLVDRLAKTTLLFVSGSNQDYPAQVLEKYLLDPPILVLGPALAAIPNAMIAELSKRGQVLCFGWRSGEIRDSRGAVTEVEADGRLAEWFPEEE